MLSYYNNFYSAFLFIFGGYLALLPEFPEQEPVGRLLLNSHGCVAIGMVGLKA